MLNRNAITKSSTMIKPSLTVSNDIHSLSVSNGINGVCQSVGDVVPTVKKKS